MSSTLYGEARKQLSALGLPTGDSSEFDSGRTFPDGGHYRIEVPTINTAAAARRVLGECRSQGIRVNRITETLGMFRHTSREIREYVELGQEYDAQILMSVGPRANYDIGGSVQTTEGARVGYRLRGQEQIVRAIEDVRRAVDLGVRGFVVYDEGLLWVLGRLRTSGSLPEDVHLKVSAHCGHGNGASAQLLEMLGADSFNPVRDLTLPMVGAIRAAIAIPIDVHVDNPRLSGGFVRTYDAPEFVRIGAPVYLKTGNSALEGHGAVPSSQQIDAVVAQVEILAEFLDRHASGLRQSEPAAPPSTTGTDEGTHG